MDSNVYRKLVEHSPEGYAYHEIITDCEGNPIDFVFLYANPAFKRMTGLPKEDVIGKRFTEIHPGIEESKSSWIDTYGKVALTGQTASFEEYFEDASRWYDISAYSDECGYFAVIFRDITERKPVENALQESEERFRLAMAVKNEGFWDWNLVSNETYFDGRYYTMAGYADGEFPQDFAGWAAHVHPEDLPDANGAINAYLSGESDCFDIEFRWKRKDGSWMWIQGRGEIVEWDQSGTPLRMIGTHADITERKRAEDALQLSESRYRSVVAVSNTGAWEYHRKEDFLWCSPEYFVMLGYDPEQFLMDGSSNLEDGWVSLLHPEDQIPASREFSEYLAAESSGMFSNYFRMRHKSGGWVWIWSRGKTIDSPDGSLSNVTVGTHINITDRIEMEHKLFREKEQFRTTLLSVGDGVISTDPEGKVLVLNPIAEQLTGWTQQEAVGQPVDTVLNIINERTRKRCDNPVAEVLATKKVVELANHTLLISRDGLERPIEDSAAPIRDEEGNVTGVVLVFRDFTEKKVALDKIEYLSYHDGLTGLYNRRFFDEELKRLDVPRNLPLTLLMLDVNGLKLTNDAFGHSAGDELLVKVANVLQDVCRADDIFARIGGDEFAVLLPQTNEDEAHQMTKRIQQVVAAEKVESFPISVSCGWATKTEQQERITDVFKTAEDHMYQHKTSERISYRHQSIKLIMQTLYTKSPREQQHSKRVSELCGQIGSAMGLEVNELTTAGVLHDIGKIAIGNEILDKSGSLSASEWQEIKRHPEVGYSILSAVNDYASLAEYVLAHHERWDGTGYPRGLKEGEIPVLARIIVVADAYDAMTSDRPYRKGMSREDAIAEVRACAGSQFDPEVVKAFIKIMQELEDVAATKDG